MIKQGSKPWRYTGKEENMQREDIKNLVKKWWDIYEDESLDYKNIIADHDKNAPSAAWLALELFFSMLQLVLVLLSATTCPYFLRDK